MKYDKELYVDHLQKMCRIPTVSSADYRKTRVSDFLELHKVLEECYPIVHQKMTKEVVGLCGLLYSYKTTKPSGKLPLLMTAHQDVVPEGDWSMWKYPPFSCEIHDNCIWGRGTTDSKNNIQAYMDALEGLFADGWEPEYDLYLGFGYNEEVMGGEGAAAPMIAELLKSRGVVLGAVIDECGGISNKGDMVYGDINFAEKGYVDVIFEALDKGGHAAWPSPNNALVKLAKTMIAIDENPMEPFMSEPVVTQFEILHKYGMLDNPEVDALCDDVRGNWDKIVEACERDPKMTAFIRTTGAITMSQGSAQANIIPERASFVVNNRVLPGQTTADLMAHYEKLLPEGVTCRVLKGTEPPTVQSVDGTMFHMLADIVAEMYPGAPMIPTMLCGGTDSRYYCDLCPSNSVYRFTGLRHDGRSGGAHQVNEHICIDVMENNVKMYVNIFTRYGTYGL